MNLQRTALLLLFNQLANAFSFWFTGTPAQCANMTVQWSNGSPPYKLLVVPIGHVDPETRVILDQTIQSGNVYSFVLKFPADSSFVAVMSDNSGIGSGGTSAVTKVASSGDKSCLATTPSSPEFFLFTDPSTPRQCETMHISYNQGAQPPVDILGVIPAGQTFELAKGAPPNSSFAWTANVKEGTQMILVAGDTKGAGTGGSTDLLNVQDGGDSSCIVSNSPSSTAGNPVGGVSTAGSPTQSGAQSGSSGSPGVSGAGSPAVETGATYDSGSGGGIVTGPSGSSSTGVPPVVTSTPRSKTPIIIGAVIGSVVLLAAIILAALVFLRRRSHNTPNDQTSQYSDSDRLTSLSPQPWTAVSNPASPGAVQSFETFPSFYNAEPFVPPASFTHPAGRMPKHTVVARTSSGTRTARAEFSRAELLAPSERRTRERVGGVGRKAIAEDRWGFWDEDERGTEGGLSGIAERGHGSAASSVVDMPPAYETIRTKEHRTFHGRER